MTHYHWTTPKARKRHICGMCGRIIHPGETYHRMAGLDGGSAWTHKECAHCKVMVRLVQDRLNEYEDYDIDLLLDFDPETLSEARVKAMFYKRWTRRDGSTWPVPVPVDRVLTYGGGVFTRTITETVEVAS